MENNTLTHHGIKGMRWGIRRFQNKDGSLTAKGKKRYGGEDPEETVEERRARLLKSTDAGELYKNRNILSTAEINERLNRIDTERRLGEVAAKNQKTVMDKVDQVLKVARKINEVYEFTNTPVMKALKKQLGLEKVEKRLSLEEALKKVDKLSDKQLNEVLTRGDNEKRLRNLIKEKSKGDSVRTDVDVLSKSIKDLSDSDLNNLMTRLARESAVQTYMDKRKKPEEDK